MKTPLKVTISSIWLDIRIFIVKMLWYYLALLIYIAIIIMFLSIILIPLFVYLNTETEWFREPFANARESGQDYFFRAIDKWLDKYDDRRKRER